MVVTRTATCPLRPHVSGLFAFRSGTRGGAPGSDGVEMCAMVRIGSGASMEEQSPSVDIWGVFGTTRAMQWERRQRPQPASLSLFEWAVGPEEVRKEELVGTRR